MLIRSIDNDLIAKKWSHFVFLCLVCLVRLLLCLYSCVPNLSTLSTLSTSVVLETQ
jgi:hypothetical protein